LIEKTLFISELKWEEYKNDELIEKISNLPFSSPEEVWNDAALESL
jgi:hypothetical protein